MLVGCCLAGPVLIGSAAAADNEIRYAYDENGRLTGVSDEGTGGAAYRWDQVGNLLSIMRYGAAETEPRWV